jgi:hypothetical protein
VPASASPPGSNSDKLVQAMFRLYFFNPMNSTTFVLFGKYCPIMDQLGLKDLSRDF